MSQVNFRINKRDISKVENVSIEYRKYIEDNKLHIFNEILFKFVDIFIKKLENKPIKYFFELFKYQNEEFEEPMLRILFKDDEKFNILD